VSDEPEEKKNEAPPGSGLSNINALAVELNIQDEVPGQTSDVDSSPASKSLADYIPVEKLLSMAISTTFGLIKPLKKYGMTNGDAEALGNAWGPVLEQYMPNVPEGPLSNALLVTGVVVSPKIMQARKESKQAKKKEGEISQDVVESGDSPPEKTEPQKETLKPISSRKQKLCI